jgi:hypothetical protein
MFYVQDLERGFVGSTQRKRWSRCGNCYEEFFISTNMYFAENSTKEMRKSVTQKIAIFSGVKFAKRQRRLRWWSRWQS